MKGATATVTAGGTPIFMAPELLCPAGLNRPSSHPTHTPDIYALGMVIYEVLTGSYPFHEQKWTEHKLIYHVMSGVRPTKPANAEQIGFAGGTWELVQKCWNGESKRRPMIGQVLAHLTCVAAYSKGVGPTPGKYRESAVNPSSKPSTLLAHDGPYLDERGSMPQVLSTTTTVQHRKVSNVFTHHRN